LKKINMKKHYYFYPVFFFTQVFILNVM